MNTELPEKEEKLPSPPSEDKGELWVNQAFKRDSMDWDFEFLRG